MFGLEQSFYFLCRNVSIHAESFLQREFSSFELTPAQANLLLLILSEYPQGTTLTQLHERLGITKSSLSSLIKPAKQKGYLQVHCFDGDERIKVLMPTDKLRRSHHRLEEAESNLQNALLHAVGQQRLEDAGQTLDELCRKGAEYLKKGAHNR